MTTIISDKMKSNDKEKKKKKEKIRCNVNPKYTSNEH